MKKLTIIFTFLYILFPSNIINAQVGFKWVKRFNLSSDIPNSISIDKTGNTYVTIYLPPAQSSVAVKYNPTGYQIWADTIPNFKTTCLAIDGNENLIIAGEVFYAFGGDYRIIKYNSSGNIQWIMDYGIFGGDYDECIYDIEVDIQGNIYALGYSFWGPYLFKYDQAGNQLWFNTSAYLRSIALDNNGNVYGTGHQNNNGNNFYTAKYNTSGIQQWAATYNGPLNGNDTACAIEVGPSGNVYVTGCGDGYGSTENYITIKYSSSGVQQWVNQYNGLGNGADVPVSIAINYIEDVYITGMSKGQNSNFDYATVKYNAAGTQQWVKRYNGPGNDTDFAVSVKLDNSGNVYVSGSSKGFFGEEYDYATIKYSSSGFQEWLIRYNHANYYKDVATAMAVDPSGGVYVTGYSYLEFPYDAATVKIIQVPPAPNLLLPPNNSISNSITPLLDWSDVIIADSFRVQIALDDRFTSIIQDKVVKNSQYQVPANVLQNNVLYYWRVRSENIIGPGWYTPEWNFKTAPIGINPISSEIPADYKLYENYPNPFNPTTSIKFDIPKSGSVKLSVYNILGRVVNVLVDENIMAGKYKFVLDASNYPNGVYFYELRTDNYIQTKKMILIK